MKKNLTKYLLELYRMYKRIGFIYTLKYIYYSIFSFRKMIALKSLSIVDKKMKSDFSVKTEKGTLFYPFDLIALCREIILKNCYSFNEEKSYTNVVDLGANCGVFSVYASRFSQRVISVDFNDAEFRPKYNHLVELNNLKNTNFIGKRVSNTSDEGQIDINSIINMFSLDSIDFLKIDIEGAEECLFTQNLEWLRKTKFIAMEVHPCFGVDVRLILIKLREYGFKYTCLDLDLNIIDDFDGQHMGYVWAMT